MKKVMIIIFCLLSTCIFAQTDIPSPFIKLAPEEAIKKAAEENKKLFVLVNAGWVGPGKLLRAVLGEPEIITELNKGFISIEIDADANEAYLQRHSVRSLPVILIFNDKAEELGRIIGALSKAQILDRLSRL